MLCHLQQCSVEREEKSHLIADEEVEDLTLKSLKNVWE